MLTRIFAELYAQLLHDDESHNDSLPTIYSSCFGEMATTLQLLDQLETDLRLSPIRFQSSVHNTASGRISLERQNRAFSTALAAGQASFAMALLEAQAWLAAHGGEVLVLVADEAVPARLEPNLKYLPLGIGLRLNSTTASGLRAQLIRHEGQHPEAQIDEQAIGKARFAPFQGAPPAWGLPLIDALSTKKRGAFPVGPGWWLELQGGE